MNKIILSVLTILGFISGKMFAQDFFELGAIPVSDEEYDGITSAPFVPMGPMGPSLPKTYSLRDDMPKAGHQMSQGSCTAWAVAYAVKSFQEKLERRWAYRNQTLFSPAFVYNSVWVPKYAANGQPIDGISIPSALRFVMRTGAVSLEELPYDPQIRNIPANRVEELKIKAAPFRAFNFSTIRHLDLALQWLYIQKSPIIICIKLDSNFAASHKGKFVWDGWSNQSHREHGYHAMVVTGWDDELVAPSGEKGAWEVMNSWGDRWGDRGYAWISYRNFREYVLEMYVLEDYIALHNETTASAPSEARPDVLSWAPPGPLAINNGRWGYSEEVFNGLVRLSQQYTNLADEAKENLRIKGEKALAQALEQKEEYKQQWDRLMNDTSRLLKRDIKNLTPKVEAASEPLKTR